MFQRIWCLLKYTYFHMSVRQQFLSSVARCFPFRSILREFQSFPCRVSYWKPTNSYIYIETVMEIQENVWTVFTSTELSMRPITAVSEKNRKKTTFPQKTLKLCNSATPQIHLTRMATPMNSKCVFWVRYMFYLIGCIIVHHHCNLLSHWKSIALTPEAKPQSRGIFV